MTGNRCAKLRAIGISGIASVVLTSLTLLFEGEPAIQSFSITTTSQGTDVVNAVSGEVLFPRGASLRVFDSEWSCLWRTAPFALTIRAAEINESTYREQAIEIARQNPGKWSFHALALATWWGLCAAGWWLIWYYFIYKPQPDKELEPAPHAG